MKIPLQKIKVNEPYKFGETVDVSDLQEMDNDIRRLETVDVSGEATVDKGLFTFRFQVSGTMILPCARTLVDVAYPFTIEAYEQFTTAQHKASEDEEIHYIDQEVLDLTPYIKENILLEVPIRVFSDETKIEDVVSHQEGFTVLDEDEYEEQEAMQHEKFEREKQKTVDPRLSSLKQYFKDDKN
ncbi:YceD family protein [Alkalibacillus aidingensis]|uniref:YceD family protein n=1 Tax=Alkalibacillus aidingensis TaxID=2747607 RepID=UPI0016602646|nr:YceD family protein [Alkalibacillus aidingensis]